MKFYSYSVDKDLIHRYNKEKSCYATLSFNKVICSPSDLFLEKVRPSHTGVLFYKLHIDSEIIIL